MRDNLALIDFNNPCVFHVAILHTTFVSPSSWIKAKSAVAAAALSKSSSLKM